MSAADSKSKETASQDAALEEEAFEWGVGQSLTPKSYKRLGQIWEMGKVWMSTKTLAVEAQDQDGSLQAIVASEVIARVPGGKKREGLAKEADLLDKKDRPLRARLFGKVPGLSDKSK